MSGVQLAPTRSDHEDLVKLVVLETHLGLLHQPRSSTDGSRAPGRHCGTNLGVDKFLAMMHSLRSEIDELG